MKVLNDQQVKLKVVLLAINIIKLNYKQNINIGRSCLNDIRINDISVSRNHCKIQLKPDGVYLVDLESKFGSLVLVKNAVMIDKLNNNHFFQIGRSVFNIAVSAKWNILPKLYNKELVTVSNLKNNYIFLNYDDEVNDVIVNINESDNSIVSSGNEDNDSDIEKEIKEINNSNVIINENNKEDVADISENLSEMINHVSNNTSRND